MKRDFGSIRKNTDTDFSKIALSTNLPGNLKVTGEYTDLVYKNGSLVNTFHDHNIVVNSFLTLVMLLLKAPHENEGVQYWAVGEGSEMWSEEDLPSPSLADTQLTNEIGRVPIGSTEFLDAEFNPSETPTNILQIKANFEEAECNGVWREFGLFGGNADQNVNTGIMIDRKIHPVFTKTNEMTIQRILRLTLSLSSD